MAVSQQDMDELKRIFTNTYDDDKSLMNRVIKGISALNNEVNTLRAENLKLKKESQK